MNSGIGHPFNLQLAAHVSGSYNYHNAGQLKFNKKSAHYIVSAHSLLYISIDILDYVNIDIFRSLKYL